MTITSFEVGAVFWLQDQFSEPLRKLLGGITEADSALTKLGEKGKLFGGMLDSSFVQAKGALSGFTDDVLAKTRVISGQFDALKLNSAKVFDGMGAGAEAGTSTAISALGRLDAALTGTAGRIASMKAEMEAMSSRLSLPASASSSIPGLGGGGGASLAHRRGGGMHFGRVGTEIPGGHVSMGGTGALAAAGVIGYGIYEAAQMRDEISRLMLTGQVKPEDYGTTSETMKKLLQGAASSTGFSVGEVGEALSKSERAMAGLDVATKLSVTKELLPYAAAEARLKETTLAESLESMVGLSHMTGIYEPEKLRDLARKFSFVSLATNATLPKFENTLSYSMPVLRTGMGMDPDTIMALTAVAQNAGITSTKSGTWLRSFFQRSEPSIGDSKEAKEHNSLLTQMGLLDANNMPTWKVNGANGTTDWNASVANEARIIAEHLKGVPVDNRMGLIKDIWGERGGGMASMLSMNTFIEQFTTLADKIQRFKGGADALEDYTKNSPVQQARETWRDFQNVLTDIGDTALPTVNRALKELDDLLKFDDPIAKLSTDLRNLIKGGVAHLFDPGTNSGPGLHRVPLTKDPVGAMPELPGLGGGYGNSPASPMAYIAGMLGGGGALADATYGGFMRAFREIQGGAASAAAGGGSGFINAAYFGTGGTGSAGGGSTGGATGGGTGGYTGGGGTTGLGTGIAGYLGKGDHIGLIAEMMLGANGSQAAAMLHHKMTPGEWCADFVNGVIEGAGGKGVNSSMAAAFGTWGKAVALNDAKRGDVLLEMHGSRIGHVGMATGEVRRDAAGNIVALGMVSGNYGQHVRHNWERAGIIGGVRRGDHVPTVSAPPPRPIEIQVHNITHLDGKQVAASVTRHQARMNEFARAIGGPDGWGHHHPAGSPMIDAA